MIPIKIGIRISTAARLKFEKIRLVAESLLTNLGTFLFNRNSTATLIDHQPLRKNAVLSEARFEGVRRVENLFSHSEQPATQTVNLDSGDYVMQLWADGTASSVTLTGQATGTLAVTGTEHKALSFNVAVGGNVIFTLTGTLLKFMLENVTGQTNQNPSEFVLPQWQYQNPLFDSIDDYGYAPNNSQYHLTTNTSISLFARVETQIPVGTSRNNILSFALGALNGWDFNYSTGLRYVNSALEDVIIGFPRPLKVWHHYVIIMDRDNSKLKLYIDGVFYDEATVNFFMTAGPSLHLGIGARDLGTLVDNRFNGFIRKLLIYDRVLDSNEISSANNGEVPLNPFRHWNFDEGSGEIIPEQTGSGDDIKLLNFDLFPTFFDTENGNTVDGGGNVIEGTGALIPEATKKGVLIEEQRTNIFLNSDVPVTQVITVVSAEQYSIFVEGTGNIVLSGAATGTVTEGSPLTFTAATTSLTCTVNGSLNIAQLESGAFSTSYIQTAATAVTRTADNLYYDFGAGNFPQSFTILMEIIPLKDSISYTDSQFRLFSTDDDRGTGNQIGTIGDSSYNFDGNTFHLNKSEFSQGIRTKIAFVLRRNGTDNRGIIIKDSVEKLNQSTVGPTEHSNLGIIRLGMYITDSFSGNFSNVLIYKNALSVQEIINLQNV